VGDEALRLALFVADDRDIAFHGVAVDVHLDRVAGFASGDDSAPNRVSVGVGDVDRLADLCLHHRDFKLRLPTSPSVGRCDRPGRAPARLQPPVRRALVDRICDGDVLSARKRGLGRICADDARPVESRSAELVLDVSDSGRIYCPDLLELERPTVEFRE
jgi:hypothetical protein